MGSWVFKHNDQITIYSRKSRSSEFSIKYRFATKKVHVASFDLVTLNSFLSAIKKAVKKAKRMTGYKPLSSFFRPDYG